MIYVQLYWSFFQIGLFSFGGGMAAIPLIQAQVVDLHGWLSVAEFTDIVTIAEMVPGPISITSATFVGLQVTNLWGAIVAILGCITPSCIILSVLAWAYSKYKNLLVMQGVLSGLRMAIIALIASAGTTILVLAVFGESGIQMGLELGIDNIDFIALGLAILGIFVLRKWKGVKPIQVMFGTGILGGMMYLGLGII